LVVNPPNRQALEALPPGSLLGARPTFGFNTSQENVQDPTLIERFWLMQMLGNLGAKRFPIVQISKKHKCV